MEQTRNFFDQLNRDYLKVHKDEAGLFWNTYTGLNDDEAGFAQATLARKSFVSDPAKLDATRMELARVAAASDSEEKRALQHGLQGWLALFESNIVDSDIARDLLRELVELDAALFAERRAHAMFHINARAEREEASPAMLYTNMATNPNEAARKSSHDALLDLERWVLDNGFVEHVGKRNQFARALGYRNYFDYKVRTNEKMSPEKLFDIFDDFERRTRDTNTRTLDKLVLEKGAQALLPHNLRYHMSGDVTRRLDPYLPFAKSLARWAESFRRLGIGFRGAQLQLDLVERKGKFQTGFCNAPVACYVDQHGRWVPAQVNFTAVAKPNQVGAGGRGIKVLFHEAGHAAHFSNVTQNSPCFSQEYAPTSAAYAETQSKFCDSLVDDPDWLKRYARDDAGNPIPDAIIRAKIETEQPYRAYQQRADLVPSYFEWALYCMSDQERTPTAVLALARATEQRILGVASDARPVLALPHVLYLDMAARYQAYLLANMAVYQTRAYLARTLGYIVDNPAVGPLLSQHYWARGNSVTHDVGLRSLTGEGFTARHLAEVCNCSVEDAWQQTQQSITAAAQRAYPTDYPATLDASIRVVHGAEPVADNRVSQAHMYAQFEAWVERNFPSDQSL